jgi:hypothetical protein
MEEIEQATGKRIIRIETNDLDEMEEVSAQLPNQWFRIVNLPTILANEKGFEIIACTLLIITFVPSS